MNESNKAPLAALESEEARTSSNNMIIKNVRFIPLTEQQQAEVEQVLEV